MINLYGKKIKTLSLSLFFLGLGIFSGVTPVRAAITVTNINIDPWDNSNLISIPNNSGEGIVFCGLDLNGSDGTYSFTVNGESSEFITYNSSGSGVVPLAVVKTIPSTAGNYSFTQTYNGTRVTGACFFVDGADKNNLIEDITTGYNSINFNSTSTIGNLNILVGSAGNGGNGYTGPAITGNNFDVMGQYGSYSRNGLESFFIGTKIATTTTTNYNFSEAGSASWWGTASVKIIKINAYSEPAPSDPDTNTPLLFNDNYSLYTNSTGLARFSYDTTEFTSSSDYLTLYKCGSLPLGTLGAVSCANATNLGTSSIWTNIDIAFNSPSGNGILSMTSTSSERTLFYVVATKTGSTNLYYPVYFYVTWNNGTPLDPNDFIGTTSSSSLELLLGGISTYSAACSYEDWNATSTYLGLNLTLARCSATKAALDLANIVGRIPTNVANGFISVLQNLFPFNIPIKIKQSFDNSTSTLPVALSYFNIADSNGNLAITLPEEWVGSTTPVAVWGPGVMTENDSAADFFAGIKAFSTYIMWFMFIIFIWHKALDIKEEATLERMPPTPESYPKENYRY